MKQWGTPAKVLFLVGCISVGLGLGAVVTRVVGGLSGGRASELAFDRIYAGDRPVVKIGQAVPSFELPELQAGKPLRLPATGRPMVINYWASWCGPCREEMPLLSGFAREQGASGIQVVGIALDDPAEARAFLARRPTGFGHLVEDPDEDDSSSHLGNLRGLLPFSVLVDAQGRLQHRKTGAFVDADELAQWVAAGLPDQPAEQQTAPN